MTHDQAHHFIDAELRRSVPDWRSVKVRLFRVATHPRTMYDYRIDGKPALARTVRVAIARALGKHAGKDMSGMSEPAADSAPPLAPVAATAVAAVLARRDVPSRPLGPTKSGWFDIKPVSK